MQAHISMKEYYEQKLSGSISLVQDTFNDMHMKLMDNSTLVNPVVNQVSILLAHGIAPDRINSVLSMTLEVLKKLVED